MSLFEIALDLDIEEYLTRGEEYEENGVIILPVLYDEDDLMQDIEMKLKLMSN